MARTLRGHTGAVRAVAFSPDARRIASAGDDLVVRIWDLASGQTIQSLTGHTRAISGLAFSPDGRQLVSGASEKTVWLWDAIAGRAMRSWSVEAVAVSSFAFFPDGRTLISGGYDQYDLIGWDTDDGRTRFTEKNVAPWSVAFSPGGTLFAVGGPQAVSLWTQFGRQMKLFSGHSDKVKSVAFTPDAKRLISASNGSIKVWAVPDRW